LDTFFWNGWFGLIKLENNKDSFDDLVKLKFIEKKSYAYYIDLISLINLTFHKLFLKSLSLISFLHFSPCLYNKILHKKRCIFDVVNMVKEQSKKIRKDLLIGRHLYIYFED
jgi:hypothetical protein